MCTLHGADSKKWKLFREKKFQTEVTKIALDLNNKKKDTTVISDMVKYKNIPCKRKNTDIRK